MPALKDLIRRVNRDMEEHRRQVEASQRAMAEQRRLMAEREAMRKRYGWLPLVLAVVTATGVFVGFTSVYLSMSGH
jgi:hypothetical protein